jgi:DNA-binding transcriptional LysR family regulator
MIRELKTFLAVAEYGTFSAAGTHIGLTQSAVSAQMQKLEDALGAALFTRTGRTATLNDAGHGALVTAREIVALFDGMVSKSDASPRASTLKVGAIASVQPVLLTRSAARFRADHPDVALRIVPGVSLELLGRVDSGDIELALMIRPPFALPAELTWRPLLREPIALAVPARSKLSDWRTALAGQPFIRYDRASFGGRQIEQFLRRRRIAVEECLELDDLDAIVAAVEAGLGVALLPRTHLLTRRRVSIRWLPLEDATFYREIGVIERRQRASAVDSTRSRRAVTALTECIEAAARELESET